MTQENRNPKQIIIEQITKDLSTNLDDSDSVWTNHPILLIRYEQSKGGGTNCFRGKKSYRGA
ncbi:hypothetical protein AB6G29_23845 [Providencia hangzhouensis]|uniref:hypothetical protein n=1 Tax=Providencia hangzhouensis TaxID=3031799 RepID=UPI0034DCE039